MACPNARGPKGHHWKGRGPDRVCSSCKKKPGHISELYLDGPKRWRENEDILKNLFKRR